APPASTATDGVVTTVDPPRMFPQPANALNVDPQLDDAAAVSQFVPAAGGQLVADASDGTIYTLTLPADALVNPTQITMTPVTALAGAPGGLVGAVKLAPEGLVLNKPATLEIQPAGSPPASERQFAFTAEGDGQDFHLLPDPDGGLTLSLLHFSAPGVADLAPSEAQTLQDRTPARTGAQYEKSIAEAVKRQDTAAQIDLSRGYYRDIARPALRAALSSDAAMDAAFAEGLGWWRQISLLGLDAALDPEIAELNDLLAQILHNAAERAHARCVNDHDLTAVHRML